MDDVTIPLPPPPPPPPPTEPPLLRRSKANRVIAGLASGVARYINVDPVLVRIGFVVLALGGGSGVLLYIIGWIAIPEEKEGDTLGPATDASGRARPLIGGLVIVVGTILLLNQVLPSLSRYFWPVVVIAVGLVVLLGARK
jgi:phage shock protein C